MHCNGGWQRTRTILEAQFPPGGHPLERAGTVCVRWTSRAMQRALLRPCHSNRPPRARQRSRACIYIYSLIPPGRSTHDMCQTSRAVRLELQRVPVRFRARRHIGGRIAQIGCVICAPRAAAHAHRRAACRAGGKRKGGGTRERRAGMYPLWCASIRHKGRAAGRIRGRGGARTVARPAACCAVFAFYSIDDARSKASVEDGRWTMLAKAWLASALWTTQMAGHERQAHREWRGTRRNDRRLSRLEDGLIPRLGSQSAQTPRRRTRS
ncbi:hypothetical protein BD413DRAFT_88203 [Trametes elegans]|nr:hypothetical protein BD413DRAFT_88203 [Trametes elegans]